MTPNPKRLPAKQPKTEESTERAAYETGYRDGHAAGTIKTQREVIAQFFELMKHDELGAEIQTDNSEVA